LDFQFQFICLFERFIVVICSRDRSPGEGDGFPSYVNPFDRPARVLLPADHEGRSFVPPVCVFKPTDTTGGGTFCPHSDVSPIGRPVDVTLSPHLAVNFNLDYPSITWLCFIFTALITSLRMISNKNSSSFGMKCVLFIHPTTI
jgi:hypothetical protein